MIHIAIVEDEKLYIDQLQEYISRYREEKRLSIKTTVFCDGEDIVEDYRGDYDIILFDIQMKFMDGMTAAEKIREIDQEVKILFMNILPFPANWIRPFPESGKSSRLI